MIKDIFVGKTCCTTWQLFHRFTNWHFFSNATWFCLRLKTFMFIYIKYVLFKKIQDKGKTTLVKLLANKTVDQHRKSIIREEITLAAKKDFPVSCCHNWFLLTIFSTSFAHAICGILSYVHDSVHSFKWLFNMHCL